MSSALPWILLGLLVLMLLAASWEDLKSRTISNGLNIAIALLAIPFWWSTGLSLWPEVAIQIGVAVAVFGLFAIAFALGAMGGGDVKLIAAVALWVPASMVPMLIMIMSLAGGALTLAMLARQHFARSEGKPEIPYGVAISFGALWLISERFLNHFG
jgi:prepilin peptidase CpaA